MELTAVRRDDGTAREETQPNEGVEIDSVPMW
jgi:hypothetical protein